MKRGTRPDPPGRRLVFAAIAVAAVIVLGALVLWRRAPRNGDGVVAPSADYVGSAVCATCHAAESERWAGSHHQRAMLLPTEENVLADFQNTVFARRGVTTRFSRKGPLFMVATEGPDGKETEYAVKYVIGVDPVQQYIVEFPVGKLQCVTVAWDVRARRWYSLYPDQRIALDDPLHWTGRYQNWNLMCGDCHTTKFQKGYEAAADSYRTTWSEFDVGCEACHGPGGAHVAWAKRHGRGARSRPSRYGSAAASDVKLLVDLKSAGGRTEVETCAPCHVRGHRLGAPRSPGGPLLDAIVPEVMRAPLYHPDGQMLDEVYEYGSFRQSKMYQRGVRCSDCHDPHSGQTKAEGNALCLACHGERPNPAFPTLAGEGVRRANPPFSQDGNQGGPVRRLPHDDPELHGGR